MLLKRATAFILAVGSAVGAPTVKRINTFTWGGDTKLRGVNIGGWLVLEPWITPSIFQKQSGVIDEYTLGQRLGADVAYRDVLKPHWDTWVTLDDFKKISKAGFNMVRIPIGFWAFDQFGAPYVKGAAPYLEKALGWARETELKVMIDLHGAPGSQNGFDNSGERDKVAWLQGQTKEQTLQVIGTIVQQFGKPEYSDVVAAIQLLNEPLMEKLGNDDGVRDFYRKGFEKIREVNKDVTVVLHDGFHQPSSWNGFLTPSDNNAQHIAIDHHEYQMFDNGMIRWNAWEHRQHVCNNAGWWSGADKWTVVGEWTAAMTDCATYLNGYLAGARFDGTLPGSTKVDNCGFRNFIEQWPQWFKDDTRGYIEAQMDAFETKTQGWIFWNFKTESAAEWDMFRLLDAGVFPQPLDNRKFSKVCTNL